LENVREVFRDLESQPRFIFRFQPTEVLKQVGTFFGTAYFDQVLVQMREEIAVIRRLSRTSSL
jgi:hypothetical protein